jgi:quinol monooxygenase YgiN
MFIRIVKMHFKSDRISDFLNNFSENKDKIRAARGCLFLDLYQDKNEKSTFFTYSGWECEQDLEHYRNSELFNRVWSQTKTMFIDKPQAWSLDRLESLP